MEPRRHRRTIGPSLILGEKTIIFHCAQDKTSSTIIFKIGHRSECYRLACRRVFTSTLIVANESIVMHTRCNGCPCLVHRLRIGLQGQYALTYTPSHTIKEKRSTCHLRTAKGNGRNETDIPKTILALTLEQSFAHLYKILLEILIMRIGLGKSLHHPYKGSIYPTITTTPITVLAILFLVRWHIILVSPPKSLFLIEQAAGKGVATPFI